MRILITGAKGFIGKNLIVELKNQGYKHIDEFDLNTDEALLNEFTASCDFVFHLAGANRPNDETDFERVNRGLTRRLLDSLRKNRNNCPIVVSSSTQAEKENPYGRSKKAGEDEIFAEEKITAFNAMVYRLPGVFGKWCRPNYNSVVATFCYNIARDLDIMINDAQTELTLVYIDDVVAEFIKALEGRENRQGSFCSVEKVYQIKLGDLADKLYLFRKNRETLVMPVLASDFDRALYATYVSYLPEDNFSYKLVKNRDNRGWLAEFIKSEGFGQIFISKTKPGIIRGNHWHHTKVEKFLVIQGEAVIKFRQVEGDDVLEYRVSGDDPEVVDIPAGYTHSISNIGENELITLFWADESFNPEKPDTYYLEV